MSTATDSDTSPTFVTGAYAASHFLMRSGCLIFHPISRGIVVLMDKLDPKRAFFLPGGRKDIGETLEACALREAYEETGYRAVFLPLVMPTQAQMASAPEAARPAGQPGSESVPVSGMGSWTPNVAHTEPFYVSIRQKYGLPKQQITFFWMMGVDINECIEPDQQRLETEGFEMHILKEEEIDKSRFIYDEDRMLARKAFALLRMNGLV